MQDDSRGLSEWFASRIDSKWTVRQVCAEIERKRMTQAFTSVETLISAIKYWISAGGNSAHNELVQAAETLVTQQVELRQWKNVFGHLGTADECGNEWNKLKDDIERKDALLRQALEAMAHGCPPDCKDGSTDSGGTYPWGEAVLIRCPTCETFDSITKEQAMTTTPLPPLPITEHNHPEHHWRWTPTEIRWINARDAQWQTYATQARADLEAENKRLREALISAKWLLERDHIDAQKMAVIDKCRAALKEQP